MPRYPGLFGPVGSEGRETRDRITRRDLSREHDLLGIYGTEHVLYRPIEHDAQTARHRSKKSFERPVPSAPSHRTKPRKPLPVLEPLSPPCAVPLASISRPYDAYRDDSPQTGSHRQ